ncbi:MAG: transposase, partial [Micrococcales bacterium]|nr:transposase [Micrococcales bacterium]
YIISFIDVKSRFKVIYLIKTKDEASAALSAFLLEFLNPLRNELQIKHNIEINLSRLHTDMGHEYLGQFEALCQAHGIRHTTTGAYTPEENSIAERYWQTLFTTSRAFLYHSKLNLRLWPFAVKYANYILNRTLLVEYNKTVRTPYEWIYNEKPNLSRIRSWGCEIYSLIDHSLRRPLDENSRKGYFMGYDGKSGQAIIYQPSEQRNYGIHTNEHIIFNEIITNRRDINSGNIIEAQLNLDRVSLPEDNRLTSSSPSSPLPLNISSQPSSSHSSHNPISPQHRSDETPEDNTTQRPSKRARREQTQTSDTMNEVYDLSTEDNAQIVENINKIVAQTLQTKTPSYKLTRSQLKQQSVLIAKRLIDRLYEGMIKQPSDNFVSP